MEIIKALPDLAQGGAWLVLAAVLIWLIVQNRKETEALAKAHRIERKEQYVQHRMEMRGMMASHSQERKDWVGKIEAAGDKYSRATSEQGEKIADALRDALRELRP